MGSSENKTKPTDAGVDAFLDAVGDAGRRADAHQVRAMMERVSGEPATMWGPSIVGFGLHHYVYASGREGDMCRIGFSPRAKEFVFYGGFLRDEALLARLGKYKAGKGCLYVRRLGDVDAGVLEEIASAAWSRERDISDGT